MWFIIESDNGLSMSGSYRLIKESWNFRLDIGAKRMVLKAGFKSNKDYKPERVLRAFDRRFSDVSRVKYKTVDNLPF